MKVMIGIGLAAAIGGAAHAQSWDMCFAGYGNHLTKAIVYRPVNTWSSAYNTDASRWNPVKAGQHNFSKGSRVYENYCVQLLQGLTVNDCYTFEVKAVEDVPNGPGAPGPMGAMKASMMENLYKRYWSTAQAGGNTSAAAFAMLVWEISHENFDAGDAVSALSQMSLTTGAFQMQDQAGDGVFDLATSWINEMVTAGTIKSFPNLIGLSNPTKQDHLMVVPVPAPAVLAGLGLLGVARGRRRSR